MDEKGSGKGRNEREEEDLKEGRKANQSGYKNRNGRDEGNFFYEVRKTIDVLYFIN